MIPGAKLQHVTKPHGGRGHKKGQVLGEIQDMYMIVHVFHIIMIYIYTHVYTLSISIDTYIYHLYKR